MTKGTTDKFNTTPAAPATAEANPAETKSAPQPKSSEPPPFPRHIPRDMLKYLV